MDKLLEEIAAEQEYIEETLDALDEALSRDKRSVIELAAISTFLQNIYNGIENCLKRILKHKKITVPSSSKSHKELIQTASEIGIISSGLRKILDEYRAFRHFAVHGYGVILDENLLLPLAENASEMWEKYHQEIIKYIKTFE